VADKWYIVDYGSKARLDAVIEEAKSRSDEDPLFRHIAIWLKRAQSSGGRLVANSRLLAMLDLNTSLKGFGR